MPLVYPLSSGALWARGERAFASDISPPVVLALAPKNTVWVGRPSPLLTGAYDMPLQLRREVRLGGVRFPAPLSH